MPRYCFECPVCDTKKTLFRSMQDRNISELCECGGIMGRDMLAEQSAVRGDYDEPIVSDSMAFDACDLAEHRQKFPGVDVVVDHDRAARPVFRSLTQKRKYLKARGWIDANSYT